jgi:hypothetical protein
MAKEPETTEATEFDGMNSKEMIEKNSKELTKIRYNDRVDLEIISDKTKHYKKGQLISPHKVMAEQLVKDKIAKAI